MIALALGVGLSGCGGGETVGEALGYDQRGPDEMTVIKRPPLIVPPDYNLRPPRPDTPRAEANAASKAARETLVGPSPETAPEIDGDDGLALVNGSPSSSAEGAAARTKATLTGQDDGGQDYQKSPPLEPKPDQVAGAAADEPPSAGQTALLSRTNRVERDINALTETRAEKRIDGALLRRLLAWTPTPADTEEGTDNGEAAAQAETNSQKIVQIVRREQTPVTSTNLE
ncbi:MAG: DUF3035 domain-containing protein [Geminicoccaceae bacterium]